MVKYTPTSSHPFPLLIPPQVPEIPGNYGLIDKKTPGDAHKKKSWVDGSDMQLIFSDEFDTDGRTFYPGDDPYWEAADLHYWATDNLEWYDPAALTTRDGALQITLSKKDTHGMHYQGGMMSTWNAFCFTGGLIEVSVRLPGLNDVLGLWPAVWTMGNLGRAGYGATVDGMVSSRNPIIVRPDQHFLHSPVAVYLRFLRCRNSAGKLLAQSFPSLADA